MSVEEGRNEHLDRYWGRGVMAGHRYWRIKGSANFSLGGGNYYWNVTEVGFFDKDYNSLTGSGTALANAVFAGYPASNAFDGSTGSLTSLNANAAQAGTGECYVGYDFGSDVEVQFARLYSSSNLTGLTIDYSDDGVTWTTAKTITGSISQGWYLLYWFGTFTDVEPSAKSYYRLMVLKTKTTSSVNRSSAAEVEMFLKTGGTDKCNGGTPFASDYDAALPPANAFDNSNTTIWTSPSNTPSKPKWIGYQFASPLIIGGFSFTMRNTSGTDDESPEALLLQAGDSTSGPWYSVMLRDGIASFALSEKRTYWSTFAQLNSRRKQVMLGSL